MTDPIRFSLDGSDIEAMPDETIWQVANRLGIEIPHLCWLPKPGYRADGNCRACMVEVEGERVLAASCIRKPAPGMKVHSASERAKFSRRAVFELLLADQPSREAAHDPDSRLWQWADRLDINDSRYPGRAPPAPDCVIVTRSGATVVPVPCVNNSTERLAGMVMLRSSP